ncbi:hypothetical protein [Butyrivibrio sp. FC2001]|uniref:hypothetical protein n=1 Tax=Butyrivibrio sp. FC2001 TaxID=1280671 RepID=UPI000428B192|nr:hypothetical protein [Butyrivibrio sp. FC2001]
MYERGECCLNMGDLYGFELNPVPQDGYKDIIGQIVKGKIDRPMGSYHTRHKDEIYAQIAFQEQFYSGVLVGM